MKRYTLDDIEKDPSFRDAVSELYNTVMAKIEKQISVYLMTRPGEMVAHSSFVRAEDENSNLVYIELMTGHVVKNDFLVSTLVGVAMYDDFSSYEEARIKCEREAREKFGQEIFITHDLKNQG